MTGLRPFKCDQCGKRFSRELNLAKHERFHTGIKPYVCKYCGKCFAQSADLKRHTSRIHTGEKPYSCDDGGKRFFNSSSLNEHKRLYGIERHTGPLQCDHCERRFKRKWDLSFHSHVHTGIKPYACEHCDKGFVRPADLKRHTRIHTGEKPYRCDLCGKSFNDASVFRRHVKTIHRAEKPGDCGDAGQKHKHVEEKPFICKDCGTAMKFGCTTLTNVFTVTNLSDVKCFMKNHTVTLQ